MSKWMTTGMWAAHFAALLGRERLRATVVSLEGRLTHTQERLAAAEHRSTKAEELLSNAEMSLLIAQEQMSNVVARLSEAEERFVRAELSWSQAQLRVQADELACEVSPESCVSTPAREGFNTYLRREADSFFNVVLALFVALCISAAVIFVNGRDFERLLDFFAYFLPLLAAIVAGIWLVFKGREGYSADPGAYYFKLSALLLICGACAYLALKGAAPQSFYSAAGFAAFVFSSHLMLGLNWAGRKSWGGRKISKAIIYTCLWFAAVAIAVPWAWMVSAEHPNVKIVTDAVRPFVS